MQRKKKQASCYKNNLCDGERKPWAGGRDTFSRDAKAVLWAVEKVNEQGSSTGRARQGAVSKAAALHVHTPGLTLISVLQLTVDASTAGWCESSCHLQLCTPAFSNEPKKMGSNCAELTTSRWVRSAAVPAAPSKASGHRQHRIHPGLGLHLWRPVLNVSITPSWSLTGNP